MINLVQFLDLIKQNTDKDHKLSQAKLREIALTKKLNIGDKGTFRRNLTTLAQTYNVGSDTDNWRIIYPGYTSETGSSKSPTQRSGSIYYNHEIHTDELDFLMHQIDLSNVYNKEEKNSFKERLIKLLASSYYKIPGTPTVLSFVSSNLSGSNLNFIQHAISEKKMIEFQILSLKLNKNNNTLKFETLKKKYWISPYRIVFHQGFYWLLGNERLTHKGDKKPVNADGCHYIKYSSSIDAFRIDRITNLKYAEEVYPKKSKTLFNFRLTDRLDLLCNNIAIYKNDCPVITSINGDDLSENYGEIEFKILWKSFPKEQREDYSFIRDSFGNNLSFSTKGKDIIITVHAAEDYFIDFALRYVDKIEITDTANGPKVKERLKAILRNANL